MNRLACLALVLSCCVLFQGAAEDTFVRQGKKIPAQRFNVMAGGGYFPVLIRLDNGDLVAALRGGDAHVGVKGRLDWTRSTDGGRTWTLTGLIDGPMDDRNPAVGQLRDGTVLVTYIIDRSYGPNGERLRKLTRDGLYTLRSLDRGQTWQPPVKSLIAVEHGASPYGKILQLPDGTALLNVYYERGPSLEHETSYVYRSTDGGKTWGDPTLIADHYNETALLALDANRLLAVARSHHGAYLATSFSSDKGRTWSRPQKITGDQEHPADVIQLKDGRLLLSHGERNRPFGVRAMLSRNLGVDWDPGILMLAADAQNRDCGYPSSAEVEPGKVVTLYYGVDESKDAAGRTSLAAEGAYARALLWSVPD